MPDGIFDHGEFGSITIKKPGSKSSIAITPEGIWVTGEDSRVSASVQFQDGMPLITVMDHRKEQHGHQIALFVTKEGEPAVQVAMGDKTIIVSGDELMKKIGG